MNLTQSTVTTENHVSADDPFSVHRQDALLFSQDFADRHMQQRALDHGLTKEGSLTLSICRLQALHELGRESLGGKLTRAEFGALLSCFQGDIFSPADIDDMAGTLADDLGEEGESLLPSKLNALGDLERFALADLLEQSWYHQCDAKSPFDVAKGLGLTFA